MFSLVSFQIEFKYPKVFLKTAFKCLDQSEVQCTTSLLLSSYIFIHSICRRCGTFNVIQSLLNIRPKYLSLLHPCWRIKVTDVPFQKSSGHIMSNKFHQQRQYLRNLNQQMFFSMMSFFVSRTDEGRCRSIYFMNKCIELKYVSYLNRIVSIVYLFTARPTT